MMQSNLQKPLPKQLIFNISAIIILCCVGVIIYSDTFHSSFQFDDNILIENLNVISNPSDIGTIWKYWASRFITFFTFALNYHFDELHVFGYHLVNLIIHLGSGLTAFWLISLLLSTPEMKEYKIAKHANLIAFLGALIFLSHPIQTESVTFIFQRATCLAGFFYILSICLYLKARLLQEQGEVLREAKGKRWTNLYILSFVFALLAMFTKENTLTLPVMILLCEFFFFEKRRYRYAIPFLILIPIIPILIIMNKSFLTRDIERLMAPGAYNQIYYFLTQFRIMMTYIRLSFIPVNQNLEYDYPLIKSLFDPSALASVLVLIVIAVAAFKLFKRHRLISFSIFWFFITILPESSLIHVKKDFIFEHWLYLPLVGYSLFLVGAAYQLLGKRNFKAMFILLLAVVTSYSVMTYARNLIWKDELTLWNDVVLKSPQKARPYNIRGLAYSNKSNFDQAISDYNKAIETNPNYASAYNNRGNAYSNKGNLDQAISDYNKAIETNPNYASAYNNRGNAYFNKGSYDQAISDCNKAIKIDPNHASAYNNRGLAYFKKGNLDQAISDYNKAIEINPNHVWAYNNRGFTYFNEKDYDKSWKDVHKVEELGYEVDPQFIAELKKASRREK